MKAWADIKREQKAPSQGAQNASVVEGTVWKISVLSLQLCKTILLEVKIKYMKGKFHPLTGHEGQEGEQMYRYTGGPSYTRIQYPRLAAARKKNWKIKEIHGS